MMVAAGGAPSVNVALAGFTVTATIPLFVFAGLAESVPLTVIVEVPAVVGVPVMVQLLLSVRPACNVPPTRAQVYGAVPPATGMVPV